MPLTAWTRLRYPLENPGFSVGGLEGPTRNAGDLDGSPQDGIAASAAPTNQPGMPTERWPEGFSGLPAAVQTGAITSELTNCVTY